MTGNPKISGKRETAGISESSVRRLSMYYRTLESAAEENVSHISSQELAESNHVTSAQVRKDLSSFGTFGKRGLGYPVDELMERLKSILGLNRLWPVVLVGVGNIGRALLDFEEFRLRGFNIVAAFDVDPKKIGNVLRSVPVHHLDDLPEMVRGLNTEIGIIAVPASNAQDVCDMLIDSGIKAILNFAPLRLKVPEGITIRYEDMSIELETLSFSLTNGRKG